MRTVLVAATTVALLATACGDDAEKSGSAGGPPVKLSGTVNDHGSKDAGDSPEIEVDDFYFGPTYLKASPGATLDVKLKNEGDVVHTFTVDGLADVTVQPGAESIASLTLPASGAVRFYCRFHQSQGMQGAFYFTAGDTVAPGTGGASSVPAGGDGAYNQ